MDSAPKIKARIEAMKKNTRGRNNYINEKHPELKELYNKIYTKKDMSYWEELDKQVKEYADKNKFMYVIDEEPFLKNPTGKPIIINYFYHEKIRQSSKK